MVICDMLNAVLRGLQGSGFPASWADICPECRRTEVGLASHLPGFEYDRLDILCPKYRKKFINQKLGVNIGDITTDFMAEIP